MAQGTERDNHDRHPSAFTLTEMVIVVIILGIIAALAIPRSIHGAEGSKAVSLIANLTLLRKAIEHYAAEHDGAFPPGNRFALVLTQYTDAVGDNSPTRTATHIYGPYLRAIPKVPIGKLGRKIRTGGRPGSGGSGGWWYDDATGEIRANSPDEAVDSHGVPFNIY